MPRKPKNNPNEENNVIEFPRRAAPAEQRVNMRELCSIKAMTAYVSNNQNVREETVRAFVETEFRVENLEQIQQDDYERVIEFLVDLRCDLLMN